MCCYIYLLDTQWRFHKFLWRAQNEQGTWWPECLTFPRVRESFRGEEAWTESWEMSRWPPGGEFQARTKSTFRKKKGPEGGGKVPRTVLGWFLWLEHHFNRSPSFLALNPQHTRLCLLSSNHPSGFAGGSDGKESACNVGNLGSIPGLGRCPGRRHGNPLQYSCLVDPQGQRRLAGCSPWGHKELDMTERLHIHTHPPTHPHPSGSAQGSSLREAFPIGPVTSHLL